MTIRHVAVVSTFLAPVWLVAGCDEEPQPSESEDQLEPVSEELRTEALEAAAAAEAEGRPLREAWERALAGLAPSVGEQCPGEALAAPRRERFVAVRAPGFSTDLEPRVLEIVESGYSYPIPVLGHAESIRFFLSRDDAVRLRAELDDEVEELPAQAVAVLKMDALRTPQAMGDSRFRAGHLVGRAYLLDAEHHPVCAMDVDSTNDSFISSDLIAGLDSFDAQALMQLFEHAQTYIDRQWDPANADRAPAAPPEE